jgi:hypothetical protein
VPRQYIIEPLDMVSLYALNYVYLGSSLRHLALILDVQHSPFAPMPQEYREQINAELPVIRGHCEKIDLSISVEIVSHWMKEFAEGRPGTFIEAKAAIEEMERVVASELKDTQFFYVEKERAAEMSRMHKEISQVWERPWEASFKNLDSASACYSHNEDTASVFHSMRAAEKVLTAMALSLKLDPGRDQWQTLIERIEKAVKNFDSEPSSSERNKKQEFYSDMAMQLRYVKNAWRNHVMHGRLFYGEKEAREIWWHIARMIIKASEELVEQPEA